MFAAVFRLRCIFVLSFVFGTFAAAYLIRFQLSRLFLNRFYLFVAVCFHLFFCFTKIVCETLCRFLYFYASLKCMFMQCIMVNRKLFGNFEFFSAPLPKRSIFLLFVPLLFLLFWIIYRKRKQKRKSLFLGYFCPKTSVFVANNILIFSDLYLYRANCTPHPRFWHSQCGSALVRKFFIFYFLFFCKIL